MTPVCLISVDGKPVSGLFMSRLVSCTVTDNEGVSSDSVAIVLNDSPPATIPRKGASISVRMGHRETGVADMGAFVAEEIEVSMLPYTMSITGKAAEMRGKAKEHREKHWDNKTIKDIVSELAGELGLSPVVGQTVGAFKYAWQAMQSESPIHFLERLAERHDAVFTVKNGRLVFTERGTGTSASGAALTPILVTPLIVSPGSARVMITDRTSYSAVKASYVDRKKARKVDVEELCDPAGQAIYRCPEQCADEAEARAVAKAKGKALKRAQMAFSCVIRGDPAARAGAPLTFALNRPGVDGLPFIIGCAAHTFTKEGYTTQLSGESQDGQSQS